MSDPDAVPLRDAATVVLVRDGHDGLEAFMVRRNLRSDFVGGAYVFPGGGVDPHDRATAVEEWCQGRSDAEASARLGLDGGGLAFWVAAIRESFEESGYLLAYDGAGELVSLDEPAIAGRMAALRGAVDRGERPLVDVCREEGLRLAVDALAYFAHWVTPEGAPRRYDTRFFLAAAPAHQTPAHDDREVIANLWVRPAEALDRQKAGEFAMLPPTVAALTALLPSPTVADALGAAAAVAEVPRVQPRVIMDDAGVRIVLPGDPEWDDGYRGDSSLGTWPSVDDRSAAVAARGEGGPGRSVSARPTEQGFVVEGDGVPDGGRG